jgi:hypothetical protein
MPSYRLMRPLDQTRLVLYLSHAKLVINPLLPLHPCHCAPFITKLHDHLVNVRMTLRVLCPSSVLNEKSLDAKYP